MKVTNTCVTFECLLIVRFFLFVSKLTNDYAGHHASLSFSVLFEIHKYDHLSKTQQQPNEYIVIITLELLHKLHLAGPSANQAQRTLRQDQTELERVRSTSPVLSFLVSSCPILFALPILFRTVPSCPCLPCLVLTHPVLYHPILSHPLFWRHVFSCLFISLLVLSHPAIFLPTLSLLLYPCP